MIHPLLPLTRRGALRLSRSMILGIAACLFAIPSARADTACREKPALIALAQHAIAAREAMPKLQSKRIGALSAYLLLRYRAIEGAEAQVVVDRLRAAKARRMEELSNARTAATGGAVAVDIDLIASSSFEVGAQRALIRSKDRPILLDAIARVETAKRLGVERTLATALLDLTDAMKTAIADEARAKGLIVLAGGLLASLPDTQPWSDLMAKLSSDEATMVAQAWYWMPAINSKADLPRQELSTSFEATFNRTAINAAFRVALRLGEADFILIYLNQTGDFKTPMAASAILLPKFSDGKPDPSRDPAAAWLEAYRALVTITGQASMIEATLRTITLSTRRHQGGDILGLIRWAAGAQTLAGAVASGGSLPDKPPPELSSPGEPSWPSLLETAAALKGKPDLAALATDPAKAAMAAELLFAARRADDLAGLIAAMPDKSASAILAEDFALRLDRLCDRHSASRGDAVFFPGEPLFRFD
jgi:hypothetical protein